MRHNTDPESGIAHTPVMWREVLKLAAETAGTGDGIFVDCTLGEGGHSEEILKALPGMRIIGIDQDAGILELAKARLKKYGERIEFQNDNFSNISRHIEKYKGRVSGILYDFGISSYHYEKSGRGFALYNDEPLDMRLDLNGKLDAYQIINNYPEKDLADIFWNYGEERYAKRVARAICEGRRKEKIKTTKQLEEIVFRSIPAQKRSKNIHPATRVFQAIRIEVNNELTLIGESLNKACQYLAPGGILAAISFHSLEDRIVKNTFRRLAAGCLCGRDSSACECTGEPLVRIITKKPVTPEQDEIRMNRRSRSAKLRACARI
jgi:16S rRNA (cytosine1402-N4)-methyltransferase